MRHQVLVDSRDRDFTKFPAPNRYRVRLPRRYTNVTGARILSADIPLTFFVFKAEYGNTSLQVTVDGTSATVTIPDGNYDDATILTELSDALDSTFAGNTFTVDIDPRTYQLVITCTQGYTVSVDTTGAPEQYTDWGLAYYLGFPRDAVTSGAPLRSPGVVNLNPFTYVLLDIDELGIIDEGGLYGSAVGKGCFCKIPVQGVSYDYVFRDIDRAGDVIPTRALVPRLESLTIEFRLHNNRVIDFRGVEHSFLLEIETRDPGPAPSPPVTRVLTVPSQAAAPQQQEPVPQKVKIVSVRPPPAAAVESRMPRLYVAFAVLAVGATAYVVWRRRAAA